MGIEVTGNLDTLPGVSESAGTFQTRQEAVLLPDSSQLLNFQVPKYTFAVKYCIATIK